MNIEMDVDLNVECPLHFGVNKKIIVGREFLSKLVSMKCL
jgi:hypothetical protein